MFTSLAVPTCVWKAARVVLYETEKLDGGQQSNVGHPHCPSSSAQQDISNCRKHGASKPNAVQKGRPHILIAFSDSGGLLMSI
jgi:hypothetical protein